MKDVSNSTLALFVVLSIVVTVFGTFLSLSKFGDVGITGFATTGTGTANLSVSATAAIFVSDDEIQLGIVPHNQTNGSRKVGDYWEVWNVGGVNISVHIFGTQTASTLYSGEDGMGPFMSNAPAGYQAGSCLNGSGSHDCFRIFCNHSSSAKGNAFCNTLPTPLNATSPGHFVANDLDWQGGFNRASFGVNVTVPPQESGGEKTQTVTFTAASSE